MNFMRRWALSDDAKYANHETRRVKEKPQLEIITQNSEEQKVRKRELLNSSSNTSKIGGLSHPKRRRTSSASFSFSSLLFNPVKTVYRFISGEDSETSVKNFPRMHEAEASTSAKTYDKLTMIDLTIDANERNDSEVEFLSEVFNVANPRGNSELTARAEKKSKNSCQIAGVDELKTRLFPSSFEQQDENYEQECDLQFIQEVERQDEEDDVEIVAEVFNSPNGSLLTNKFSVESAKEQVTFLSSSINSPSRSDSSVSIIDENDSVLNDDSAHDQISTSSPTPEDSISRQGTPYGLRFSCVPYNEGDPWRRRKPAIQKNKSESSQMTSFAKSFARTHTGNIKRDGVGNSTVNLQARDHLLDIIEKMGGNKVIYPTRSAGNFVPVEIVDKRKPFKKARRVVGECDGVRRVRSALDKCLRENSKCEPSKKCEANDIDKLFERQSSSEQQSDSGESVLPVSTELSNDTGSHISSNTEIQSSRSLTPASTMSCGVDRITVLLDKMNSLGRHPTPDQKYNRFIAERRELRGREIALQEEVRIRNLARLNSREHIEDQARRRLKLIGIHVPPTKPRIKDEFPTLSDEAQKLCQYIWNKRLPETEEFSEAFGIKLTRKDLSTLSGLDWLNDEVINFYLQLVCQRSINSKTLPKVYAFNTFFYANISTKGYSSVRRWTRKVDIFEFDMLLVPVHLSVHWCVAVVDLAEKRIDYYDSLLGRNQKCLDNLKNYLSDEYKDKKNEIFDFSGWEFSLRTDIPRQLNGSDCGVFACKFAEFASRRAPIVFTQQHMPYYRQRMVYELVEQKLL